ncbi:hypothetical protein ACOME3_004023 [Neoechinorhynchus agilis]
MAIKPIFLHPFHRLTIHLQKTTSTSLVYISETFRSFRITMKKQLIALLLVFALVGTFNAKWILKDDSSQSNSDDSADDSSGSSESNSSSKERLHVKDQKNWRSMRFRGIKA